MFWRVAQNPGTSTIARFAMCPITFCCFFRFRIERLVSKFTNSSRRLRKSLAPTAVRVLRIGEVCLGSDRRAIL
jgi:hypothetical protein